MISLLVVIRNLFPLPRDNVIIDTVLNALLNTQVIYKAEAFALSPIHQLS